VHSLNILVKYARLYGFQHKRTEEQFAIAWEELQAAMPEAGQAGLVLGVADNKLLLDGIPLEAGQAERSFAQLLSAAGLASMQFSTQVTRADFIGLIRAFALGGSKAQDVAEQIRESLGEKGQESIKINQIRFVAQDPATGDVPLAAQLAAQNLGPEFREWLSNPQKLLQLIAAAEGAQARSGGGTVLAADGSVAPVVGNATISQAGGQAAAPALTSLGESEIVQAIRLLTKFGEISQEGAPSDSSSEELKKDLGQTDANIRATLQNLLEKMATQVVSGKQQDEAPVLMKAAEHLAIRFAMDRFQRGEVRVNAVHETLERMSRQMETLRKVLKVQEDKMSRAGLLVESHADILDRQFWAEVPEAGKRSVLLSADAPCVPPRNIRSYLEELLRRGDVEGTGAILNNYCDCLASSDPESSRKAAVGLSQLADLFAAAGGDFLNNAVQTVGEQMQKDGGLELQGLLSAAFVRLSQEATQRKQYQAVQAAMTAMQKLEQKHPVLVQDLRPRVGVENRLPDFLEEAMKADRCPNDMLEVLRQTPKAAAEQLAERFSHCHRREECDRLAEITRQLGEPAVEHLRHMLEHSPVRQASFVVGLLSRLSHLALLELLPARLREWNRFYHDITVRQIALSNAPERGLVLLELLDVLDPLVLPQAIDEIGLSGDTSAGPSLLVLATDGINSARSPFLQLKAVEALGRLREETALPLLQQIVETKKLWKWVHPRELRIAAGQALKKIDPTCAKKVLDQSGLSPDDLDLAPLDRRLNEPWVRQRKYQRFTPERSLSAVASSSWGRAMLGVRGLSLGGGVAARQDDLRLGAEANLELQLGLRHVKTRVMLRRAKQGEISFEIVEMDLEERSKLRKMLSEHVEQFIREDD